ncbi:hypothetical protein [Leucobacter ruminantium]|uniref:Uncharacterized protein n=1 Tax=Leucobacter ruminantium TaxID=1289170 RepID=A0A939RX08_9MICO|nr:hypothetical protein [Leucobacter ruminantium]MBO1805612.1 hypothetical protein [Leucobacter ruminantium]
MQNFDPVAPDPVGELTLAAGTRDDLPALRAWLASLPAGAYGQVLIESDEPVGSLPTPELVSVNRVPLGLEPGEGLSRAVRAWCDEWLWVDSDVDRSVQLWMGAEEQPVMRECWGRIDRRISRRHYAAGATQAMSQHA